MTEYYYNVFILIVIGFVALSVVGLLIWEMIKSQLRFQAICENSGSFVLIGKAVTGKKGKIIDVEIVGCNEVYARHLHMEVNEITGLRIVRDFFDGAEPEWLDVVRDVISTHESRHFDFSYEPFGTRYSGSVFNLSSVRKRCCFIMEETSSEYKRKTELARIRNMMDMILEMSGIAMWEWNLKTNHISVINASIKIVSEYNRQNLDVNDVIDKIYPDDRKAILSLKPTPPEEHRPASPVEYRLKDRQGEWRWFQAVAVKTNYDDNGIPESMVGVTFDIDTLKRSQLKVQEVSAELELNQQRLFHTLRQSRTGFVRWNVQTDKIQFGEHFWKAIGKYPLATDISEPGTMEELREKVLFDDPDAIEEWVNAVREGRRSVDDFYFRCQISFLPGVWLEVRNSVSELDQDGRPLSVDGFVIDITNLKRHEDALRSAMEAADEANKAKGRFLAIMSHEIRTPLNAIIGFSSIMQNADISRQLQSYAQSIKNSGEMLLYLINDLLDLAKIDSAKLELKFEPVNLVQLLSEIREMFEFKVKKRNLYLNLNCDSQLPLFSLDLKRIQQVFVNLVGNAVKFTKKGGITVDVLAEPAETCGSFSGNTGLYRLVVSVRDTGVGIPEKDFETIFNPFEQAANNHDHYVEGTGLGLAICRNLVQLMGGNLTFESVVGQGSNFVVTFNEIEVVPDIAESTTIRSALPPPRVELYDAAALKPIPRKILTRLHRSFGERFEYLITGLHVQSARALIDDLSLWMKDNNTFEIEETVDLLRRAVDDFDVTEVRRIATMFIKRSDENGT